MALQTSSTPFIGRNTIINEFNQQLTVHGNGPYKVWYIRGTVGTGKSRLMHELHTKVVAQAAEYMLVPALLDIRNLLPYPQHGGGQTNLHETALLELRKMLGLHKVAFPTFDLVLLRYWAECRKFYKFDQQQLVDLGLWGTIADIVKGSSDAGNDEGELLKEIGKWAEEAALSLKVADLAIRARDAYKRYTIQQQSSLRDLPNYKGYELLAKLTDCLANDLNAHLSQKNRKLFLFVDSHDLIIGYSSPEVGWQANDTWLRSLVRQVRTSQFQHIWVIAGRRRSLFWEQESIAEFIHKCVVEEFTIDEARQYMNGLGAIAVAVQDRILDSGHGNAWLLERIALVYSENGNQTDPGLVTFPLYIPAITEHFLRGVSPSELATLRALSEVGCWDEELFRRVAVGMHTGYPLTEHQFFVDYHSSFIVEWKGYYRLCSAVRSALNAGLASKDKQRLRGIWRSYLDDKFLELVG